MEHKGTCSSLKPRFKGDKKIENGVWLANNVTILSGVRIGDGAIVGVNSVVTKDIPLSTVVVGGNPAIFIKKLII